MVADELVNGSPAHELVGLSTATGQDRAEPERRPGGLDPGRPPAAHRADARRRACRLRLRRELRRLLDVPRVGHRRCPRPAARPPCSTVDAAAGESQGAVWMGGAAPVVDAGGNIWVDAGQRLGHLVEPRLRRQRLGARAVARRSRWCSTSPRRRGPSDNATRPRPVDRRRRCWPTARWWPPASRASSTCSTGRSLGRHRRPAGGARRAPAATTSTVASPSWARPSTCPA